MFYNVFRYFVAKSKVKSQKSNTFNCITFDLTLLTFELPAKFGFAQHCGCNEHIDAQVVIALHLVCPGRAAFWLIRILIH